jgi:hypothetical protein
MSLAGQFALTSHACAAMLAGGDRAFIDTLLARTLTRPEILAAVR